MLPQLAKGSTSRRISAEEALEELRRTGELVDAVLDEPLHLRALPGDEYSTGAHRFLRCSLSSLVGHFLEYAGAVSLEDCQVGELDMSASYFLAGLLIRGCTFTGLVDFQCGGHNRDGTVVRFEDTVFQRFVNFFDCDFDGPIELRRCAFEAGTNLLGNRDQPFMVGFVVAPVIEECTGSVDLDGEG